ncbi:AAA family ATPase, partial [Sphaerospermopsis reniformis]|uniref:AAA family ATPase n=1 Tax=Sphaerospermopsis reniformis TaxID=531300 RepID=UPI00139685DA
MKLTSIKLCNFRSFYGQTPEITIATGDIKNTTIIHGNNGAGKTSLLNAFTWVLYEKFTAAFAATEQLVNKRAIAEVENEQPVECWVEVGWEHEGNRYRAKRTCRVYKNATNMEATKTKLIIQTVGDDGKWYFPIEQAEEIINNILPASLHQYFFFDGERIEEIDEIVLDAFAAGVVMLLDDETLTIPTPKQPYIKQLQQALELE